MPPFSTLYVGKWKFRKTELCVVWWLRTNERKSKKRGISLTDLLVIHRLTPNQEDASARLLSRGQKRIIRQFLMTMTILCIEVYFICIVTANESSRHSLTSRPSSMTVGDCRWPLYRLSSPLLPILWHLLQLNVATSTPLFYVVHPLSFGSSLVT